MPRTKNVTVEATCPECKGKIKLEGGKNVVKSLKGMIEKFSCGPCAPARRKQKS